MNEIILDLTLIFVSASIFAFLCRIIKLPALIGYLVAGIVLGSNTILNIDNESLIEALSELGIIFLLFVLGLKIDFSELAKLGEEIIIAALINLLAFTLLGLSMMLFIDISLLGALVLGVAISFSSTLVVIKMLEDRKELEDDHGKLGVGILLVQDFIAITGLVLISSFDSGGEESTLITFLSTILSLLLMFVITHLLSRTAFPFIVNKIRGQKELIFLFAIAWALAVTGIISYFGFGTELGGLLAGHTFAHSKDKFKLNKKIKVMRDFFLILFFTSTGLLLDFSNFSRAIFYAIFISIVVTILKPILFTNILTRFKTPLKESAIAGLTLSQISEFSLILGSAALAAGIINSAVFAILSLTVLITFTVSSIIITHSEKIYKKVGDKLLFFKS